MEQSKNKTNNVRVAFIGSRGIPNSYGGFETLVEELAKSFVAFGAAVTVYCRKQYFKNHPRQFKGARLVYLSTIRHKILDTPVHTVLSVLHAIIRNTADIFVIVNVGNAPFAALAKLFGKKVIFCVDGLDWERKKWNAFARWYLKSCSYIAKYVATEVVTDAASVREFYEQTRRTNSTHIPYGTDIESDGETNNDILVRYKLENKKYFIYVARFEPENNPLLVVEAYVASGSKLPLVMVGDNRYNPEFVKKIKNAANERVHFLGFVFGEAYKQLVKHSLAYVRAAEVGGISPAVIEAMGRGICVVANDKPENREPLGETSIFYRLSVADLANQFRLLSEAPERALSLGQKSAERAMLMYSWDAVAYEYFKLVKKAAHKPMLSKVAQKNRKKNQGYKRKKMLITGAGGMLGQAIYEKCRKKYEILATSRRSHEPWLTALDVTDEGSFEKVVANFHPDYIVHLAALTNLEECERDLPKAYTVNTLSVKYAAQLSTRYGAKLVYISTSGIFDGEKKAYREGDEPCPKTVYGLTKQAGAMMAEYYARDYLTLRLGWLIGGGPTKDKKFVAKIVEQIVAGKKKLHALADISGSISYTQDVAENLLVLLGEDARGIYHLTNSGFATRYDIAKEIIKILGYQDRIEVTPVDAGFFSHSFTVTRPRSECLATERLDREGLNCMRPWQVALADYLKEDFAYAFSGTKKQFGHHAVYRTAV